MNYKSSIVAVFSIIMLASLVLAATTISLSDSRLKFSRSDTQETFIITNSGNSTIDISYPTSLNIAQGTKTASFITSTTDSLTNIVQGGKVNVNVTLTGAFSDFNFGSYEINLPVNAVNSVNMTETDQKQVTLEYIRGFCDEGPVGGDLEISKVKIDNRDGKDDEWELLDTIEIEVEVENNGNDDIKDVFVEMGLFDSDGRNIADEMDFENIDDEILDLGKINDGKDEKDIFKFRIPADITDGSYDLAIKAYSDDLGEDEQCVDTSEDLNNDFFETIDIDRISDEDQFIVVEDIVMDSQATCGDTVTGEFTIFNVGDGGTEERVQIQMRNVELGVSQEFEELSDLDEGDDKTFSFSFQIPQGVENKLYAIEFQTFYDYKSGVYRENSADKFPGFVTVLGCEGSSVSGQSNILITASLSSAAKAGENLIVSSTITNTGPRETDIIVNARGFESWSDSVDISNRLITAGQGQSRTVTFTFDVKDDAEGANSFFIEATSGGILKSQEVEVNIAPSDSSSSRITGFAGLFGGEGGNLIWVIGIINVVLIILIIVVAVRLSRK